MTLHAVGKVKLYFGTSSALYDLTQHMEDGWQLVGNVNVARRRRVTGSGSLGLSAYGVQQGLSVVGTIRLHADTKALLTGGGDGFAWVEDGNSSPGRVVCFPAQVKARPVTTPSADVATFALALVMSAAGAVEDALKTSGSQNPSGKIGYQRQSNKIVQITSAATASSSQPIVVGTPWTTEG